MSDAGSQQITAFTSNFVMTLSKFSSKFGEIGLELRTKSVVYTSYDQ